MAVAPGFVLAANSGIEAYINGIKITDANTPPLFDIQNFLPGDEAAGTVRIENNDSAGIDAGVRSTVSGSTALARRIGIEIRQGTATIFAGKLSEFFAASGEGLILSRIGGNESATYNFLLTYPGGETELQNEAVGFDLDFGVLDRQKKFTHIGGQPGPKRPGDARLFQFNNVLNRRTGDNHCAISYQTSAAAAGQIIYSAEDEDHSFKYNQAPQYGYAHIYPVMADDDYASSHNFDIPNIDPCKNYYFRIVARVKGGGPTVSGEYLAVRTRDCGQVAGAATVQAAVGDAGAAENLIQSGRVAGAAIENAAAELPVDIAANAEPGKNAAESCKNGLPWWMFLILAAAGIWGAVVCGRRYNQIADPKIKKVLRRCIAGWLAYAILNAAVAVWILLAHICLFWGWFALAAGIGLAGAAWGRAAAKI